MEGERERRTNKTGRYLFCGTQVNRQSCKDVKVSELESFAACLINSCRNVTLLAQAISGNYTVQH